MISSSIDADMASTMLREGHTIKGTGRVMGFDTISVAGQQLEMLWRRVQSEELAPSAEIGEGIVRVASQLTAAGGGDPETGTPELVEAMRRLDEALGAVSSAAKPKLRAVESVEVAAPDEAVTPAVATQPAGAPESSEPPAAPSIDEAAQRRRINPQTSETATPIVDRDDAATDAPQHSDPPEPDEFLHEYVRPRRPKVPEVALPELEPVRSVETPAAASITADLGGLLGAVESWASVETLPVSAGRMYRLINLVARIRIDLEATDARIRSVRNSDDLDSLEAAFGAILLAANELEHDAMQLAAVPLSSMTNTLPQLVRFVAKKLDKEVRFEIVGDTEVVVDRQVLDKIADPLRQLVVNCITHGIESAEQRQKTDKAPTGSISLSAFVKDRRAELVVSDDGHGINWDSVRQSSIDNGLLSAAEAADTSKLNDVLFNPGFSTGRTSDLGGSGKGLSSVSEAAESLFGRVRLESTPGQGTTVTMTVPTSRALQRVMIFESAGMQWGIPEAVVEEVLPIDGAAIDSSGESPMLAWRGEQLPMAPLGDLVGATDDQPPKHILVISHRVGSVAITVRSVDGIREVAAKELGPLLAGPSHITGAALLGGGEVVLVLDAAALVARTRSVPAEELPGSRVLVVDDSIGARAVVSGALASSGFVTSVASSASEALDILAGNEVDALVVDFSMPQQDGADLVAEVRERGINVPVVMLSGVASEEDKTRSKEAGVDVFFDKADFREGALAETLRGMLGSS
jgi:two-component system chemotaxis sensor kinase CheA